MSENKRAAFKEWLSSGKTNLQPLTFSQRELWETSPVVAADTANHICCLIYLRGLITPEACETALRRVVERQEVLRVSFLPGKNWPIQMIRQSSEPNIGFCELSSTNRSEEAIEELAHEKNPKRAAAEPGWHPQGKMGVDPPELVKQDKLRD